jgi:hypothetical protein
MRARLREILSQLSEGEPLLGQQADEPVAFGFELLQLHGEVILLPIALHDSPRKKPGPGVAIQRPGETEDPSRASHSAARRQLPSVEIFPVLAVEPLQGRLDVGIGAIEQRLPDEPEHFEWVSHAARDRDVAGVGDGGLEFLLEPRIHAAQDDPVCCTPQSRYTGAAAAAALRRCAMSKIT